MEEDWDFYRLRVNDRPASIFLNLSLKQAAPMPGYNRCAYLQVKMRKPREDGLSSQEEYDDLIALEEAVAPAISAATGAIYVGRDTTAGNRDLFFYLKEDVEFPAAVITAMSAFPDYAYDWGIRADRDWTVYLDFLFPSASAMEQIAERRAADRPED